MKGTYKGRKISALIEQFAGNEIHAAYGVNYAYWFGMDLISWADKEDQDTNVHWKKWLKDNLDFELTNDNIFTMSILHELGHHYTQNMFSEEQWESESAAKDNISDEINDDNYEDQQMKYFDMPTERAATEWAVQIYNANKVAMKHWNKRFMCAIKHFEKKYNTYMFERI